MHWDSDLSFSKDRYHRKGDEKESVVEGNELDEKKCIETKDILLDLTNLPEHISTSHVGCFICNGSDVSKRVDNSKEREEIERLKSSEHLTKADVENLLDVAIESTKTRALHAKDGLQKCFDSEFSLAKSVSGRNITSTGKAVKYQVKDQVSEDVVHSEDETRFFKKTTTNIQSTNTCTVHTDAKKENSRWDKELKVFSSIDVYSKTDMFPCDITGSCFHEDGFLLVVDNANQSVKSLDVTENCLLSVALLNGSPWDITYIDSRGWIATTIPKTGKIQLLSVSEEGFLKKEHEISVDANCRAIAYNHGCFIVTYGHCRSEKGGKIQIVYTSGLLLRTISQDLFGNLFLYPSHLALSKDHKTIYVTDFAKRSITSLQFDGTVNAVFTDDDFIKDPRCLTVGPDGNLYVCDFLSNCVHILSNDLRKVKMIADSNHGVVTPRSIVLNEKDNMLYVTMFNKQCIAVLGEE